MFLKSVNGEIAVVIEEVQSPEGDKALTVVTRSDNSPRWELRELHQPADDEGRLKFLHYWREWHPQHQPLGCPAPLELSDEEALRRIVGGALHGVMPQFAPGALEALVSKFPEGEFHHLFDTADGFLHRFRVLSDLTLVAKARGGSPITFSSEKGLKSLAAEHLKAVADGL